MRCTYLMALVSITASGMLAGTAFGQGEPVNCLTTYIGPPGGDWRLASNWSLAIPRDGDAACVSGDAVDSLNLPDSITVRVFGPSRDRKRILHHAARARLC